MRFDGADYTPTRDDPRLTSQYKRIWAFMLDGNWHSLSDIAEDTGDPEASVSAQLRHMRKERFGKHTIEREHEGGGLYYYRLVPATEETQGVLL